MPVTAFATYGKDGGPIIGINTAMLRLSNGDRDALAATVIGHELGHLKADHVRKSQQNAAAIGLPAAIVGIAIDARAARRGVDTAGLGRRGAELGGGLVLSKFNRDQEREADELSIRAMHAQGFDIHAAPRLWRVLLSLGNGGSGSWFASHPSNAERAETLEQLAAALLTPPAVIAAMPPATTTVSPAGDIQRNEGTSQPATVALALPPNALRYLDGPGWTCKPGYVRQGESCIPNGTNSELNSGDKDVQLPQNAIGYLDRSGWNCLPGFHRVENYCQPDPPPVPPENECGVAAVPDAGRNCRAAALPKNARADPVRGWVCNEGFVDYAGRICVPLISPVTASRQSN